MLNDEKVLKVLGNAKIGDISYNEESIIEEGIVDLDSGSRFEGRLLIEGKMGIPFGFGKMDDDDDDGKLMYKGIMINWKRFGYGVSYHDNGEKEYEGYLKLIMKEMEVNQSILKSHDYIYLTIVF